MGEGVYPNGLPHPSPALRLRIAAELATVSVLTLVFLLYAPRHTGLYIGMALIGMGLVGFSARETREKIWGPPASPEFDRVRRCTINMSMLTLPPIAVFLVIGVVYDHKILNINFLWTLCFYLPWALLQQSLFQFYLLGRLRALLPFASPLLLSIINGVAYGLVHIPGGWELTLVTIIGGIFWSYSYHRDRYVLPIAISHALLASTFFCFVYGRDLIWEFFSK